MNIRLHKNATTTPARRAYIQSTDKSVRELAQELGVSEDTIRRWKKRDTVDDRSHTAHRLQTTLNREQEALVLVLRRTLGLTLDDLVTVTREFIHPGASRSGLHRLLKRHGISRPSPEITDKISRKSFKDYFPGFVHIDVKYLPKMADEDSRRYLFVAIDRATRWVFVKVYDDKSAASAHDFLSALHKHTEIKIVKILTDNGKEFTDRLFGGRAREATGQHEFDQLCQALGIEHRLTEPNTPQTNGMVERFNGRIADVLRTHHFQSGEELETTLLRYVWLYNHHLPQKALGYQTPMQAMKKHYDEHPECFVRKPRNRPGRDT